MTALDDDLEIPAFLDRRDKSEAHAARTHARLAPSAAHRWMQCPGSVPMSAGVEETGSVYANEGTAAHELASHCLKMGFDADRFLMWVIDIEGQSAPLMFLPDAAMADGKTRFLITTEMAAGVQEYVDHVREIVHSAKGEVDLDVEQRLDMTHVHSDCSGTGDVVIYDHEAAHLHVGDLKYGKGVVVEIHDNPQTLLYGAGAVKRYGNRPIERLTLFVAQPRADHGEGTVRSWECHPLELMEWEADLAAAAERVDVAVAKRGQAMPTPWEKTFLNPGEWCRFCPALPSCPAARERSEQIALAEFAEDRIEAPRPEKLTGDQLAKVLEEAEYLGNWIKAVQEYAHAEATAGRCPPGWKLVAKRATRKWKDEAGVEDEIATAFDLPSDQMHTEPVLKSPAQIEAIVGKKAFKTFEAEHVTKVSSGTNLAPESDSRPAVKADGLQEFAE